MASVGTLTVDLIAQTASFNSNVEKAARNLNSNAARMNKSLSGVQQRLDGMANAARAASFALAAGAFVQLTKNALEYASSLKETAQQVGVTAKQLQVFNFIGSQVGVSQEDMQKGLSKLTVSLGQAALGADKPAKAFAALGVNIRDANGNVKTAGDVIPQISDALSKVQDPAQRAAAEVALFGRAGQKLDNVLTQGAKGLENYAKQAEDAGMVISDSLIDKADEAADRVAALTTQLKVSFAREVASNADAILGLANALSKLTFGALNFIATYPRLSGALAGAAMGARMGGAPGAAIGTGVGFMVGELGARGAANSNMDIGFRSGELKKALEDQTSLLQAKKGGSLFSIRRDSGSTGGTIEGATAEVKRQTALLRQATSLQRQITAEKSAPILPGVDLEEFLAKGGGGSSKKTRTPKGPKGPSAESIRNRAIRDAEAFANQLASLDGDLLNAKRDNVTDISQLVDISRQQVNVELDKLKENIKADVALGTYSNAQGELLQEKVEQLRNERQLTIGTEQLLKKWDDELELQIAANDNQKELLEIQDQLAVTASDRRAIQLRILDAERKNLELELQKALLNSRDVEERKRIQAQLDAAPGVFAGRAEIIRRQTEGPLEAYIRSTDPNRINERVEGLVVDQLEAVRTGINDAVANALGVQDPLLRGLIDMFLEQVLIRPIAMALQNAQMNSGGGVGGFFGMIANLFGGMSAGGIARSNATVAATHADPLLAGMFANGTLNAPRGLAIVGEAGPEVIRFKGGEQVYNQRMLRAANDSGDTFNLAVSFPGVTNEREARGTANQLNSGLRRAVAHSARFA